MRKGVLVFGIAALASVLANAAYSHQLMLRILHQQTVQLKL